MLYDLPSNSRNFILVYMFYRSSHQRILQKNVFNNWAKFTGKRLCWSIFLLKFIKNETPTQMFSCEFCKLFNNNYLYKSCEQLPKVLSLGKDVQQLINHQWNVYFTLWLFTITWLPWSLVFFFTLKLSYPLFMCLTFS